MTRPGNRSGRPLGGAVRAAAQVGHLLAEHDGAWVALQPAPGDRGDGVGVGQLLAGRAVRGQVARRHEGNAPPLAAGAAHAVGGGLRPRPQLGAHRPGAALSVDRAGVHRRLHRPLAAAADVRHLVRRQDARFLHRLRQHAGHLAAGVLRLLVAAAVTERAAGHVAGVVEAAVALRLDHRRAPAAAQAIRHVAHQPVDRHRVAAVDDVAVHVVGGGAHRQVLHRRRLPHAGGDGVQVVLHEADQRQLPEPGHVQRLVQGALVQGAVAHEAHHHAVAAGLLLRIRRTRRQRQPAGHDGVGAEEPRLRVAQVHRPAAPAAVAGRQPHDLGHGAPHHLQALRGQLLGGGVPARRHPVLQRLGQELVVGAVGGGELVGRAQCRHHAGGGRLLADAGVHRPPHGVAALQLQQRQLEAVDQQHVEQHARRHPGRQRRQVALLGAPPLPSERRSKILLLHNA